jgi:hypothetical protein
MTQELVRVDDGELVDLAHYLAHLPSTAPAPR